MRIVLQESLFSGLVLHLGIRNEAKPHVRLLKQIGHVVFDANQTVGGHEHSVVVFLLDGFGVKQLNLADLVKERINYMSLILTVHTVCRVLRREEDFKHIALFFLLLFLSHFTRLLVVHLHFRIAKHDALLAVVIARVRNLAVDARALEYFGLMAYCMDSKSGILKDDRLIVFGTGDINDVTIGQWEVMGAHFCVRYSDPSKNTRVLFRRQST